MVDYIDERYQNISITVIVEGWADVTAVTYFPTVQANEPFTITYRVQNTGNTDTLWGGLYANGTTEIPVTPPGGVTTYWTQTVAAGAFVTPDPVTINYPIGITSSITGYEIRVGHQTYS